MITTVGFVAIQDLFWTILMSVMFVKRLMAVNNKLAESAISSSRSRSISRARSISSQLQQSAPAQAQAQAQSTVTRLPNGSRSISHLQRMKTPQSTNMQAGAISLPNVSPNT